MQGKICLITGANTGIGYFTAKELAQKGATVVLACRDEQKARAAAEALKKETANPNIEAMVVDMSSLASVRSFAAQFLAKYPALHVLINNAGLIIGERKVTPEGLEATFATNFAGPFLLTNLLLDRLKESAPSRIVNVSSAAHQLGKLNLDDLQSERSYSKFRVYGTTKLEMNLFSDELARRLAGTKVTSNSLHPGTVGTNFGQSGGGIYAWLARLVRSLLLRPEDGAKTSVYLASSPEVEGVSGKYFERCKPTKTSRASQDANAAKQLWTATEKLVGLFAS